MPLRWKYDYLHDRRLFHRTLPGVATGEIGDTTRPIIRQKYKKSQESSGQIKTDHHRGKTELNCKNKLGNPRRSVCQQGQKLQKSGPELVKTRLIRNEVCSVDREC